MSKRRPNRILPSVEYLRQCFIYYPKIGQLRWKERPRDHFDNDGDWSRWNTSHVGSITGYLNHNGYLRTGIGNHPYWTHRLIWKLFTGEESPEIDHIDGNRANNAWENLRTATRPQQNYNRRHRRKSFSGFRGVYAERASGRWYAQIRIKGVKRYLGTFDTPEEASAAVETVARRLHGAFYLRNPPD